MSLVRAVVIQKFSVLSRFLVLYGRLFAIRFVTVSSCYHVLLKTDIKIGMHAKDWILTYLSCLPVSWHRKIRQHPERGVVLCVYFSDTRFLSTYSTYLSALVNTLDCETAT